MSKAKPCPSCHRKGTWNEKYQTCSAVGCKRNIHLIRIAQVAEEALTRADAAGDRRRAKGG